MPNWKKYKKKEIIVEAFMYKGGYVHGVVKNDDGMPVISMPSGDIHVNKGEYILKSGKGMYETMPADEFENSFVSVHENTGEILDCPCCGTQSSVVSKEQTSGNGILFYVRCGNKDCRLRTKNCGSKTEAIEIWNKRT